MYDYYFFYLILKEKAGILSKFSNNYCYKNL